MGLVEADTEAMKNKRGRPLGNCERVLEMREQILQMRSGSNPLSGRKIAKKLGISFQRVFQILNIGSSPRPYSPPHSNLVRSQPKKPSKRNTQKRQRLMNKVAVLRDCVEPTPSWALIGKTLGISHDTARRYYLGIYYASHRREENRKTIPIDQLDPENLPDLPQFRGKGYQRKTISKELVKDMALEDPRSVPDFEEPGGRIKTLSGLLKRNLQSPGGGKDGLKDQMVEMRLQGTTYGKIDKSLELKEGTAKEICQQNEFLRKTSTQMLRRNVFRKQLIKLIQDPQLIQHGGNIKGMQICIQMPIIGDSAVDKVMADDGDVKATIRHLLSVLPEPRLLAIRYLAMVVAKEQLGVAKAAKFLGVSLSSFYNAEIWCQEMLGLVPNDLEEENGGG